MLAGKNKLSFRNDVVVYLLSSLFAAALSFVFTFLLTHLLPPEEIGKIDSFVSIVGLGTTLILFGSNSHLVKYYSENKSDHYSVVFQGLVSNAVVVSILTAILGVVFDYDIFLIACFIITTVSMSFYTIILTSLQLEKKSIHYAFINILYSILTFSTSLVFIYIYRSAGARIGSVAIILLVLSCYLLFSSNKLDRLKMTFDRSFYVTGYVLFITQILSWLLEKSDRILISKYLDFGATGLYSVGYQFGMVLLMVQIAISRAWMPRIIDNFKHGDHRRIRTDIWKLSAGLLISASLLSLLSLFVIKVVLPSEYDSAALIAIVITFAYAFDGIWKLYNGILIYHSKYTAALFPMAIAGGCNLIINIFFLANFGFIVAAVSTLISFIIGLLVARYLVKVKYNLIDKT